MQSITATILPSGRGKIYLSPLGLSEDQKFLKTIRGQIKRRENALRREFSTPQPIGPSCDLSERKSYVPNELSQIGRVGVLEGCGYIEDMFGRMCTGFFTGTLPTRKDEDWDECIAAWPRVIAKFIDKVRYHMRSCGAPDLWVIRVEYHKDGWPHLHMVYLSKLHRKGSWIFTKALMKKLWQDSWVRNVPRLASKDWSSSTRVETIRKSASRYMAKYMTKEVGGLVLSRPSSIKRYWGSSQRLKRQIRLSTYKKSFEGWDMTYSALRDQLMALDGRAGYSRLIVTASGGMWQAITFSKNSLEKVVSILDAFAHPRYRSDTYDSSRCLGLAID